MPTNLQEMLSIVTKHTHKFKKEKGQFSVNNHDQELATSILNKVGYQFSISPAKQKSWNIKYWR